MKSLTIESKTLLAGVGEREFAGGPSVDLWSGDITDAPPARPLKPLAPGPWRSLGRYLDYSNWADRERFVELDRAIQSNAQLDRDEIASLPEPQPAFRRAVHIERRKPEVPALWGLRLIGSSRSYRGKRAAAR